MSNFSKSFAAFLFAAYRSLHSRAAWRILCLQYPSGHWVMCKLSHSAVFTSSAFSHDHPSRLSTLSTSAAKPSAPGLILLFCMASHACLHSGTHDSLLVSIVFNSAKVWYRINPVSFDQHCKHNLLRSHVCSCRPQSAQDLRHEPTQGLFTRHSTLDCKHLFR